jgi:Zn-dependent protease
MVAGRVSKKENGIIALAGPISNILLFGFGLLAGGFLISLTSTPWVTDLALFWLWGNAILGAFNMLPFGPLDGRKVKDWSEPIFWSFLTLTIGLVYLAFTGKAELLLQQVSNFF